MIHSYHSTIRRIVFTLFSVVSAVAFLGINNKVYATHAAGSDLSYRWISGNIYEITVNFYRDCQGVAAPGTVTLNVKATSCGQNFNVTLNPISGTGQEITFPCNPTFTYCNGGTNPGIQQYTYRGNVTLPSQCIDWVFSYSVCCRNCAISTITNQANCNNSSTGNALYVEAYLNNVVANHNSSPTFTNIPVAFVCANQAFTFNHGVIDPNGDSLAYSFINPKRSATVDVGWLAGYSATNWLTSAPPVAINASTGDITMLPTLDGQVAVCAVLVKEYRAGVLIGSVIRDMQFWIKDCGTNLLPTATGINGTSNFSTIVCAGSTTCFTINSNDPNIGQHILMTSTATTSIPGSTFTITNQNGASPNYPVGTFCWTPSAADARDQPYTFTVMVKDDNCNYNSFQIYSYSIVVPRHIITFVSPTYNGYHISCNTGSNGSVTANVSGNQTPISYLWSTGATTQTVNGLSAGTYGITITDVNGCKKDTTVTLTQPSALALSVSSIAANCNANTNATGTAIPSGGIAPYTYLWSNGQTIQTATGLTGGNTYSVTITDANGCTKTGSTTITQPAALSSSISSTTNVSCNGQSTGAIDLTVTGGTSPYTYLWNNGATTQDLSGLSAGTYTVTITDSHGCTATRSQIITQPGVIVPLITSTSINGVNVACFGDATGTASVSATGGTLPYSYLWSTGATTSSLSGLTAGTVSVTITDANGCLGNGSLTLTQPGGPIVITLDSLKNYNGFGTSCNGASNGGIFISVSGGTPGYLYFWSNGDVTQDITGLAAGNYSITVFDANGCTASQTYTITPPAPLSVTVTSPVNGGGYNIACNGESSGSANTAVSGGAAPYNYIWSNGATTQNLINLPAGTYSVSVTDANGCSGTGSVTLTEPVILVPLITGVTVNGGTNVTCNGGTDGSASVSATGGSLPYTYLWSNGATTSSVSGLGAGTISVTVYDLNGCSNQDAFTFTEPALISITSSLSAYNGYNVGCDGATNGSIDATVTGGTSPYTYVWSNGATIQDINSLSAGTYSVTVTDANGCTSVSSKTLTEPTPVSPILTSPTVTGGTNLSCNGSTNGNINVTTSGGVSPYSYLWSNGATTQNLSSVGAGTYTVTVTDGNNCTVTASITLTQPDPVSPTLTSPTFSGGFNISCNGLFDGIITTSVTGGTSPYSYIWSNGETSQDLGSLTAGTYTVTITDVNGCTSTGSKTLTQPTPVVLSFSLSTYGGSNVGCYGSSNGSIDLTVTGGTGPYTYEWTNEATTQDLTGLTAGTYGVVVNDANGCPAVDSVTLTQPDTLVSTLISPTFNGGYNVTCLGNDGSIDLTLTGGTAPYTYIWSNAVTTQDLAGLGAGTYNVTISDANGCTSTGSITLTQSSTLTLSAALSSYNGTNISCNGSTDGSIDLTVSGGASPFTYSWSNGATTQDLSSLGAGTYSVTVTDANNCSTTANSTITQPAPLTSPTVSSSYNGGYNVGCNGSTNGSINLTPAGGTAPYTYIWSNGQTTQDLANLGAGTFTVTVTDLNGCTSSTSVTLTEPTPFTNTLTSPTFAGGFNVTCLGNDGSIDLTPAGGTSPYSYNWNTGATTQDLTGLGAGIYTVTITDANGCSSTGSITLTQSSTLTLAATLSSYNGNNISCNGISDGSIDLTVTGGAAPFTYSWSNGATTQDLSSLGAGTYTVTVTDANNCSTTATSTITQPSPLTSPTVSSTYNGGYNIACSGSVNGSIDLTPAGGTFPFSYNWSNGSTSQDLSNVGAGIYSVTVTDLNGCTVSTSVTLTEPDTIGLTPISPTFAGGYNVTCIGNDGSIDLTVTGGASPYTYLWSNGSTTQDLSALGAGTFTVTVTDANGCTNVSSITLTQSGNLTATLTPSSYNENGVSCNGATDGYINTTVSGGAIPYTYVWSNGATTANISGLGAGTYSVTITDANSCNVVKTESLVQPDVLSISTQIVTDVSCNSAGDGSIDITVVGGTLPPYIYIWSNGSTNEDLTNLSGGTYTVTVTDVNNCSYITSYTINEPVILSVSVSSSSNPTCNGDNNGTIDLSVAGGTAAYIYNWSNGATTQDLSGLDGGTFSVTVTDVNGCTATTSSTIILVEPLVLTITPSFQNVSCNGNGDGNISLSVSGGTPAYNYNWSNGNTASALINISPGTFSVTVTDANGCSATSSLTITQPLPLTATITSYTDTLGCNAVGTGAIDILVSGGTTAYTYNWNNGSTTQDLSGLPSGNYNVTITDANGCTTTLTTDLIIIQVSFPIANANVTNVTGCFANSNGAIDLTITDGQAPFTYTWSNGATIQDLLNLPAGVYSVTVLDVNSCSTTTTATVTEPLQLTATVSPSSTDVTCFGACDGSIDLNITGGTPSFTYQWSNGATTASLTNLCPAIYDVTVTDANGCTASTSEEITEPELLIATVDSYTDTLGCNATGTGAIDISVSGGTTAYSYNWNNGSTAQDLSGLSSGNYNVTITDANGCTTTLSADLIIVQVNQPIANAVATSVTLCNGDSTGSIDLAIADGQAPFTYIWSNGATIQDLLNLPAGVYSVTVLDVNSCSTTTTATVTEPLQLTATVSPSSTDVTCFGACDGSIDLNITGGTPSFTYQWSNGATTASLTNLCPAIYDVTVTDANGCTASTSEEITEPELLIATVDSYTDTLGCNATGTGAIDISVSGGTTAYSYNWNNGSTAQDLSGLSSGNYNVTITDANGCTTTLSADLIIVQVNQPIANAIATSVTLCNGDSTGSIDLTITDGQAPFTYIWSNGETTQDLINLPAGVYSVTVIDVNSCSTTTTATVTEPLALVATSINPTNVTCFGLADGEIDFNPLGGTQPYTFIWSNGETTEDIIGLDPSVYNVTVTDANGCTAIGTANITEPDVLMIMDTVITNVTCFGSLNGGIDIMVMGGTAAYSYSWSNGATTEDLTNISGTLYYVTVTDVNNCQVIDSFNVNEPTQLFADITITDSIACSGINSDTINLTVSGGTAAYNFNWSNGATTEDLTDVAAGNYTVTITDANGCTTTATVNLTEPQPLTATATQSQAVNCNGNATGEAVVSASGGTAPYTFVWSTTSVNDTITGLLAATYFVTVTDAHGCSDTTSVIITQPLVLDATIVSITDVNCQDLLSGAIDITEVGGTSPYNYNWSNAETTQDLNSIAAGTYFVTVTDANGCTDTLSAIVEPAISVSVSITADDTISCNGANDGQLTAVVLSGGTGPFTFLWSNTDTTQTILNLSAGTYTVTVTNSIGCTYEATYQLINPPMPNFTGGGTTVACETDATLTATLPAGYTGTWTLINGTGNIADPSLPVTAVTGLGNTINVFVWTITNGTCTFTDTATLIVTDLNVDAGNDQSTCDSVNIQLSGSMSSGSGTWSSPDNGITFSDETNPDATTSGLTVGTNTIIWTVTDGNCTAIDTVIITVKPPEECNEDTLQMPTGFSPNGDGPNDYFVIHGLIHYPDNQFKVFNRWGNLVYEKKNYNNEWDGTNNSGDKLPDGTYFVIFESTNLTTPLSGYVDMRR